MTQTPPLRVLVDLSHAADGYVGIAQDVRLIFDMLARLPGVAPTGLLMPTGRHDLPRLDPDDAASAAAVLHWMARNWESHRFPRLLGRLGPVTDLPRLLRRRHGLIPLRLPQRSGALWRVLFEKTLAPERREAVLRCPFLATDLSVMRIIDRAMLLPHLAPKLLDACGFDAVLFCMPRPVRLPPGVRQIVRFHDAVPLTDIDTVSGWRIAVAHRRLVRLCSPDAVFVCNSPQSVEDLALLDPSRAERAQVIPCALPEPAEAALPVAAIVASRRSFRALGAAAGPPQGLAPLDGEPRYVLTVSTLEPRKNYPNLIRAWERVVQRHDPELKLVIVANRGWREDVILREMAPHVRAGRILHLQDVPREELAALARAATCFAFPSFGEGFGYPPLEAMQAGTPAVVSDIPVFRWLLGDAALFVDPYDVEAIAAGIARLVDSGNAGAALRADLLARAPAVLARFAPGVVAAHWAALLDTVRATPKVRAIMPAV